MQAYIEHKVDPQARIKKWRLDAIPVLLLIRFQVLAGIFRILVI
jgi:hypothetical protein